MASLAELARTHTDLDGERLAHLHRLVASWGLLADLCFADLLLFARCRGDAEQFVIMAQVRPTTSQTLYKHDLVGTVVDDVERPLVARAFRLGEIVEGEINLSLIQERVRVLSIPVRHEGEVIGVVTRESAPSVGRPLGELEQVYLEIFWRLASMIEHGLFPFPAQGSEGEETPRVGDGVMLLDQDGRVDYASPNAVSALHRIGIHANAHGMRLSELGFEEGVVRTAFALAVPVTEEVERGPEVTVLVRCVPLLEPGNRVTGALVLMRDISELRRRDRLLISMDATIREIHHRVKNNLQTISALLGLQARRMQTDEAREAVADTQRRIRSIALVHEILSRDAGDDVAYGEVARDLVRMVGEGLSSPERRVEFRVEGDPGLLPARVATPLSVVITELLTNAVEHAYPADGDRAGSVVLQMGNDGEVLVLRVIDDGEGLPDGFDLDEASGLGLTIVRTLVESELGGTIEMRTAGPEGGTVAEVRLPSQTTTHHVER